MLVADTLSLEGAVLTPASSGYEQARRLWNAAVDKRPALIARCASTDDVVASVAYARANGLELAVRGGGHSAAGHSMSDGGVTIDLSSMKEIHVDPATRTARVQPGVLLGELDRATQEYGLAVPAGTVSHTGVAGLTLGGGIGWLMRKHGLTIDQLLEVELVTADAEVARASAEENPDLFWAVRGAGANFGVVTEFVFRTQEVGPTVLGGLLLYPFERAASVFRAARDVLADAPDELTTSLVMLTVPPHEPFPQELWGAHAAVVAPTYTGDLAEGGRVISRLREIEKPALDVVGPMPYVALQSMLDATASFGLHQYNAAETLVELRDAGIDALLEAFVTVPSPRSHVILTQLGGAVARVPETATAFGNRDGAYLAWVISMWEPTEHAEAHVRWAREIRRSVRSLATGGTYVNALEPDAARTDRLRASYGVNWPRLVELKRRWDPDNAFRLNQNIR